MNTLESEVQAAKVELERRRNSEKGRYYEPNGAFERVLKGISKLDPNSKKIYKIIIRAGNSAGKTCFAVNLANYLSDRIKNPYFDKVGYFKKFRKDFPGRNGRPARGRILTTANACKNTYPDEILKWFSTAKYSPAKRGRDFASYYKFHRTKNEFDMFTFDQDSMAGESITLDWAIVDEPMSRRHYSGLVSRFRFGGIIFFILTPLEGSGWYHDELEREDRIITDQNPDGDVMVFEISALENTIEYGVRGVIPAKALESQYEDYDEAELPARRDGKYLHLAGIIYGAYRSGYLDADGRIIGHEPDKLAPYYLDCWKNKKFTLRNIIDPHDRKPFAVGWLATFPNDDTFCVAEWPDESMRPFHKIHSWNWGVKEYVDMIKATEEVLGKPADQRWIDPNFGPAPKVNSQENVMQMFARISREENYPMWFMLPPDSIKQRHIRVKGLLGDPAKGVRPKLFAMEHCKNFRFGFSHYGWKENKDETKGLAEVPMLQHKDFMDLIGYGAMGGNGLVYLNPSNTRQELYTPEVMGNNYVRV